MEVKASKKNFKFGSLKLTPEQIINDYRLSYKSRQASLIGRREVMGGKAKFGIFGDGKEVPQVAMAHAFQHGDFRSGYYRDQTLLFALGIHSIEEFFAQLYAHADTNYEPGTGGRQMNCHFAVPLLDESGDFLNLQKRYNTSADLSPTGSQMPRLVGLAHASRLYRELPGLKDLSIFSDNGSEVAFGTIGNASCAEGMFWESVNAIGVLKSPAVITIWDDEYGISVSNKDQHTKSDLHEMLKGFQRKSRSKEGFDLHQVKAWDYAALIQTFQKATSVARKDHVPSIIHVVEVTQPQGHSTSGSHERYKSKERLAWEREYDCVAKMREWLIDEEIADEAQVTEWEQADLAEIERMRDEAWEAYLNPIRQEVSELVDILSRADSGNNGSGTVSKIVSRLKGLQTPYRRDIMSAIRDAQIALRNDSSDIVENLRQWKRAQVRINTERYGSHLYSESEQSPFKVDYVEPVYEDGAESLMGFELLNACFDAALARDPRIIAFGEDVGQLGDVNQGFKGMQEKYGKLRVFDTGIRECTIIGQAIGLAMRGLRPIAEIQYLDYVLYALQIMSDDLATLHWRTRGGQKAPAIIRTRGHRLEGVWHAGSPMAGIIHLVRGMHVLVPRNMTQAAGFYNTLLQSDDPALVVEVLNGYRIREKLPSNVGEFTLPLGVPEVLKSGNDISLVTYGASCAVVLEASRLLQQCDIDAEVIDVQSLLPFDVNGIIGSSLKKTNRIAFIDEDVPGGTTAYMMSEVLENQGGYHHLDSQPITIAAKAHRPAYGSDGDYWSKPTPETIFERVYGLMHESNPAKYPMFL